MAAGWLGAFDVAVVVRGADRLAEIAPGAVVVVQGGGLLEGLVLAASLPRPVRFILPAACFRWPLLGRALRRMGHLPFEPGRDGRTLIRQGRALFRTGDHVGVFCPEVAAVADTAGLQYAARLAWRARCPIVPIALFGLAEILPSAHRIPRVGTVRVRIGDPFRGSGEATDGRPGVAIRRLAEEIRQRLLALADPLRESPPEQAQSAGTGSEGLARSGETPAL